MLQEREGAPAMSVVALSPAGVQGHGDSPPVPAQCRAPQGHPMHRSIQGWGTWKTTGSVFTFECRYPNSALSGTAVSLHEHAKHAKTTAKHLVGTT